MNRLKFSLVLLALGAMSSAAFAAPRTRSAAKAIAQEKATELGVTMTSTARRVAATTSTTDEEAAYYIFNNGNDQGFTIVSGDDRMPEIIGYSDEGSIDEDNLPEGLKDLLSYVTQTYNNLDSESTTTSTASKAPRRATSYTGTTNKAIGPLLTTKWSQFEPYYNLTPTSSGTHCATCCVATAMAQIIYYLYATQDGQTSTTFSNGITSGSYTVSGSRTYDWSSMLPSYLSGYTDAQATAVATLMRDCGYALNAVGGQINYGVDESTAYQYKTPSAYSTYFGITNVSDTYASSQSTISDASTFFSKIDNELNNYRPVQVCGNSHSFVCDGRTADGKYYHFNFGYAGGGDGFYCAGAYNGYDQYSDMEITYGFTLSNPTNTSTNLSVAYNSAIKTMGLRPVGTIPGMYQQGYYETLKGYLDTAKGVLDGTSSTSSETTLINNIGTAEQNLIKYVTPFANSTTSGSSYTQNGTAYYIRTYSTWSGSNYGMYTNYYSTDSIVTCLYPVSSSWTGYKFRLFYDSSTNGYYIGNNTMTQYINQVKSYGADPTWKAVGDPNTSSNYNKKPTDVGGSPCEIIPTDYLGDGTFAVTIRPMGSGYTDDQDRYFAAWYDNGSDDPTLATSSTAPSYVCGGDPYGDTYSKWLLVPAYNTSSSFTVPTVTTGTASFANSTVEIETGSSATQTVTTNSNGAVTYSSSDITVAVVDPTTGEVTGVGEGTATITAAIGATAAYLVSGYTAVVATYTVNVVKPAITAPVLAEATDITTNSFTTSWDAVDGAAQYELTLEGSKTTEEEVTEQMEYTIPGITPLFTEDWSKISTSTTATSPTFNSTQLTTTSISNYSSNSWTTVSYVYRATNFPGIRLGYTTQRGPTTSLSAGTLTTGTITKPTDTNNITVAVWASQTGSQSSSTATLTITVGSNSTTVTPASIPSTLTKDNAKCYLFNTTASSDFTVKLTDASATAIIYYIGVYPGTYETQAALEAALASTTGTKDTTYVKKTTETTTPVTVTTTGTSYTFTGLDNNYTYTCQGRSISNDATSTWGNTIRVELSPSLRGDVNRSGTVDIADVAALVKIVMGNATRGDVNNFDFNAAHVDDDEISDDTKIDISDVKALVNIVLGK